MMKMRGLAASLLALVMCVSMGTAAFADNLTAPTLGSGDVHAAKLHDTRNEAEDDSKNNAIEDSDLVKDYKVSYDNGKIIVTAADLKEHQNQNTPESMGYWIGVAFNGPVDAKTFDLDSPETKGANVEATDTQTDGSVNGFAIYFDAAKTKSHTMTITWKKEGGETVGVDKVTIDLSGVKLYGAEDKPTTVKPSSSSSSNKRENPLDQWSGDIFEMESAGKGDLVKVDLAASNGKIPGSLLEALNDSEAALEMTYGSLVYTVHPGDIQVESGRLYWPLDMFLDLLNGLKNK